MDKHIVYEQSKAWIPNPTDPEENFADRWEKYPEREKAFRDWLKQARKDFYAVALSPNRKSAKEELKSRFGTNSQVLVIKQNSGLTNNKSVKNPTLILNPSHRKEPPWPSRKQGGVSIEKAILKRKGFRDVNYSSGSYKLQKHTNLIFQAVTNIIKPYRVYWQVVNTGNEAIIANGLRGGFNEGQVTTGKLTRKESTLYTGSHSIECFIVKDGYLTARSGQFIVNIQ